MHRVLFNLKSIYLMKILQKIWFDILWHDQSPHQNFQWIKLSLNQSSKLWFLNSIKFGFTNYTHLTCDIYSKVYMWQNLEYYKI